MEDLSQRKPPQLNIKAEDTTPTGENGALVWSTAEGRHLTYNENAGRYGIVGVYPALGSIRMPAANYYTFPELTSATNMSAAADSQYFVPFYLAENRNIASVGYQVVNAASSGSAAVGIYNTQVVNGISMPYELLTSATNMNITTTGIKTAAPSPSITLRAGILYWVSILVTGGVTIRACIPPTRMLQSTFTVLLVSLRLSNNSGNLVDPAPSSPSNYDGVSLSPLLVYT